MGFNNFALKLVLDEALVAEVFERVATIQFKALETIFGMDHVAGDRAVDDIAFTDGVLLAQVSPLHASTALAAITMTGIVSAALVYRAPRGRTGAMTLANVLLVSVYVINSYVLFGRAA